MHGDDVTAHNSAYLVSGLRNDLRDIGKELRGEIHDDTQQMLSSLRKEMQSTLDIVADIRESTVGVLVTRLKEDIHKILAEAGWPLKVDFTPIQEEFHIGEVDRRNEYISQMQSLEESLGQKIGPILREIPTLRSLHDQLKVNFEETHKRMLDEMSGMRKTFVEDITKKLERMEETQQTVIRETSNLEFRLEEQLVKYVQEKPVNVDFDKVMKQVEESYRLGLADHADMMMKLEIMHGDVKESGHESAHAIEMRLLERQRSAPQVETDSNWAQTDIVETATVQSQTDDKLWKVKANINVKKTGDNMMRDSTGGYDIRDAINQRRSQTGDVSKYRKPKKEKTVIVDAESMKKKARAALMKVQYDVHDCYYQKGICQCIAKSPIFENSTFLVVSLNALWISIDADNNNADLLIDADPMFQVAENIFCTYFVLELSIRFAAFKKKRNAFKDFWFVFDFILVALMVLETWVMTIVFLSLGSGKSLVVDASLLRLLRMVKILRLSRLARVMRAVPEIIIFLKGIGAASRSVAALLALWAIIIYIFAVFFVQTSGTEMKKSHFETVPTAMNYLLLDGILADNAPLVNTIGEDNLYFWPVIMFFVLIASVTLSYMLIGVLVQIVQVIAVTEKERYIVGTVANHLRKVWEEAGYPMEGNINFDQFQSLLVEPAVALFLHDVNVDMLVLVDMAEMIYEDISKEHDGVNFSHFVDAVLNMRGTNPVTVQDVKSQLRVMKRMISESVVLLQSEMRKQMMTSSKQINHVRRLMLGDESILEELNNDEEDMMVQRFTDDQDEDLDKHLNKWG